MFGLSMSFLQADYLNTCLVRTIVSSMYIYAESLYVHVHCLLDHQRVGCEIVTNIELILLDRLIGG